MLRFIDLLKAVNTLLAIQNATYEQLAAGGRETAARLELYAKQHAPWHDRTGNARRTLEGFCIDEIKTIVIGVCGNMPYSPNLELGFHGRYAVLLPTIEMNSIYMVDMVRSAVAAAALSASPGEGGVSVE